MNAVREAEKKCFMKAFKDYIVPYMNKAKDKKVILRKDLTNTVFFEFVEENELVTTVRFPDDLLFAFRIAVDAIYDSTKPDHTKTNYKPEYSIQAYEDYAIVTLV